MTCTGRHCAQKKLLMLTGQTPETLQLLMGRRYAYDKGAIRSQSSFQFFLAESTKDFTVFRLDCCLTGLTGLLRFVNVSATEHMGV